MSACEGRKPRKCKACRSLLARSGRGPHNWSSAHRILGTRQISSHCTPQNLGCPRKVYSQSLEGPCRHSLCPSHQEEISIDRKRAWASMEITQKYTRLARVWSQPQIRTALVNSCFTKLQRSTLISNMIKRFYNKLNKQTKSFGIRRAGILPRLMRA